MIAKLLEPVSADDIALVAGVLGGLREPDLIIADDDLKPYLIRWHLIPHRQVGANVYLHVQVANDPYRPLHDHPWDNMSVILRGGYKEVWRPQPWLSWHHDAERIFGEGDTIYRKSEEAHRLLMRPEFPYTITIFSTGPKVRDWGFWFESGWRSNDEVLLYNGKTRTSTMTQEAQDAFAAENSEGR